MPPWTRRSFLTGAGLGVAGLATGLSRRGHATELTAEQRALLLPEANRPEGVLELFLFGGLNAFDTFYVVPEYGVGSPGRMWNAFQEGPNGIPAWFDNCGGVGDLLQPFGEDAAGRTVNLGPFLYPLRDRPDILERMRIVVLAHDDSTHQSGVPHMLCGHKRNNPRMAATPAHVQRHFQDAFAERESPWTYVLYPDLFDLSVLNGDAAGAIGLHSASARPMTLRLGAEGLDAYQLQRPTHGEYRSDHDRLVAHYTAQYRSKMRFGGQDVRSRHLEDFESARRALERTPQVLDLLPKSAFSGLSGSECGEVSDADYTAMGLELGVQMLTHPTDAAKYVTVMDGGLLPAAGGGAYDTHFSHVSQSARNVVHMARELADRINAPDENDPRKVDLDRHMVLLTTEFGRSPVGNAGGLDHWPFGYVVVMIGGSVGPDQQGVVGAIDDEGLALDPLTPADFRASLLLSQGIWPFSDASFAVGDITDGDDEARAAEFLRSRVLGYGG
jgi:hypothetical protein